MSGDLRRLTWKNWNSARQRQHGAVTSTEVGTHFLDVSKIDDPVDIVCIGILDMTVDVIGNIDRYLAAPVLGKCEHHDFAEYLATSHAVELTTSGPRCRADVLIAQEKPRWRVNAPRSRSERDNN